jgi:hypothetical protein
MVTGVYLLFFCPSVSMKGFTTYCKIQILRLQRKIRFLVISIPSSITSQFATKITHTHRRGKAVSVILCMRITSSTGTLRVPSTPTKLTWSMSCCSGLLGGCNKKTVDSWYSLTSQNTWMMILYRSKVQVKLYLCTLRRHKLPPRSNENCGLLD